MALLQPRPIEELRALVGARGADLSDEQLMRCELGSILVAELIVGEIRDRRNPLMAEARAARQQTAHDRSMASRRRRYPRERAQKALKRAAAGKR